MSPLRDNRTGLEVIDREECLGLLGEEAVGRVAVIVGSEPVIFPVNYALDGERIVFRTAAGSKFHGVLRGSKVSFEIDRFDPAAHEGWSVLAVGVAAEVLAAAEVRRLVDEIDLQPWANGDKDHWMAITPQRLSGRRVVARN